MIVSDWQARTLREFFGLLIVRIGVWITCGKSNPERRRALLLRAGLYRHPTTTRKPR